MIFLSLFAYVAAQSCACTSATCAQSFTISSCMALSAQCPSGQTCQAVLTVKSTDGSYLSALSSVSKPSCSFSPTAFFNSKTCLTITETFTGQLLHFVVRNENKWYDAPVNYGITVTSVVSECSRGCRSAWIGDMGCDAECNVQACRWDGGDCDVKAPVATPNPPAVPPVPDAISVALSLFAELQNAKKNGVKRFVCSEGINAGFEAVMQPPDISSVFQGDQCLSSECKLFTFPVSGSGTFHVSCEVECAFNAVAGGVFGEIAGRIAEKICSTAIDKNPKVNTRISSTRSGVNRVMVVSNRVGTSDTFVASRTITAPMTAGDVPQTAAQNPVKAPSADEKARAARDAAAADAAADEAAEARRAKKAAEAAEAADAAKAADTANAAKSARTATELASDVPIKAIAGVLGTAGTACLAGISAWIYKKKKKAPAPDAAAADEAPAAAAHDASAEGTEMPEMQSAREV
jgi:hypothetical protein